MQKRIVITGGSGFVGTNLVEYYFTHGWHVENFDIKPPQNGQHAGLWKNADLRNRELLIDEIRKAKPEVILHCGARTDLDEKHNLDGYSANIDGVLHLIEAIREVGTVQRVVFFSSQLVCGIGYKPRNAHDYQPTTLYGRSKVIGEKIVFAAGDFCPVWTIVRPTSLWGPWFDIPYKSLFIAIKNGRYFHPKGFRTLKQWGFIGNTVYQIQRLVEAPRKKIHNRIFYLADYEPLELSNFTNQVQTALNSPPIKSVPFGVLKAAAGMGDVFQKLGWRNPPLTRFRLNNILIDEVQDVEPLRDVIGNIPCGIEEGIEMTIRWLKEHAT